MPTAIAVEPQASPAEKMAKAAAFISAARRLIQSAANDYANMEDPDTLKVDTLDAMSDLCADIVDHKDGLLEMISISKIAGWPAEAVVDGRYEGIEIMRLDDPFPYGIGVRGAVYGSKHIADAATGDTYWHPSREAAIAHLCALLDIALGNAYDPA